MAPVACIEQVTHGQSGAEMLTPSDLSEPKIERALTRRQAQVLELVAKRRTLKQIASELSISESAVNQHIKAMKASLGVNSLPELAEVYRGLSDSMGEATCRKSTSRISGLSEPAESGQQPQPNGLDPVVSFNDALRYRLDAPWNESTGPVVVPGLLRGANAKLVRSALIVGIAVGFFALVLVGLGVAQGLSSMMAR